MYWSSYLKMGGTMVKHLEHVFYILGVLNDKVKLHIEFSSNKL